MTVGEAFPGLAARLRDALTFPLNFDPARESFSAWQSRTQAHLRHVLDIGTITPPAARAVGHWQDGNLVGTHLRVTFSNGEDADGYLLQPRLERPTPAVLLLHDHGAFFDIGKEKMIRRGDETAQAAADADAWAARLYGGRHVGNALARRGYSVLAVDALGWGGRRIGGYESQQALAANLLQFGVSLAAVVLREDLEAAVFLQSLPGVDPARIACLGFSMGGARSWQVAALSDVVRASVAGGWMGTLSGLMQPGGNQLRGQSAFYMLHPPIAGRLDYPHFAGLAAPKPALFFNGRQDRHFPAHDSEAAFRQLHTLWHAAGARPSLETRMTASAHVFEPAEQDAAFDWLDAALSSPDRGLRRRDDPPRREACHSGRGLLTHIGPSGLDRGQLPVEFCRVEIVPPDRDDAVRDRQRSHHRQGDAPAVLVDEHIDPFVQDDVSVGRDAGDGPVDAKPRADAEVAVERAYVLPALDVGKRDVVVQHILCQHVDGLVDAVGAPMGKECLGGIDCGHDGLLGGPAATIVGADASVKHDGVEYRQDDDAVVNAGRHRLAVRDASLRP
jgi:dienelactone hydrolase